MKAMILAAGQGTRVRPITQVLPKPMIPLVRKPVMEFLVEHLKAHGVKQIMVNTSHLAPVIEEYFRDGDHFGVQMAYSFEGDLIGGQIEGKAIGSAGGMKKIQDFSGFFDETFVVLCGDALVDVDFAEVVRFHRDRQSIATLVLRDVPPEDVSKYGVVQTDTSGRIVRFQEKPTRQEAVSSTINTGIYVFEPEIFRYIPAGVEFDIGGQLLPELLRNEQNVFGITLPFTWLDIGSVPDYWKATGLLLSGKVAGFTMPGNQIRPGIHCGINVQIEWDRVQIDGPVYIGSSTSVGNGATIIGPTVVGSGCVIQPGATVRECILADYTRISSVAVLERKLVFGSKCIDPSGRYLDIQESQVRWLMDDARTKEELSPGELELMDELKTLNGLVTPGHAKPESLLTNVSGTGEEETMKIGERKIGTSVVLEVHETRLAADKAAAFKNVVGRYLEDGSASVFLDLSQVIFIDSSGLGAVLSIFKRMPKDRELIICGATDPVMSMFKLTRLDRVFTMRRTVDEAVSTLAL